MKKKWNFRSKILPNKAHITPQVNKSVTLPTNNYSFGDSDEIYWQQWIIFHFLPVFLTKKDLEKLAANAWHEKCIVGLRDFELKIVEQIDRHTEVAIVRLLLIQLHLHALIIY